MTLEKPRYDEKAVTRYVIDELGGGRSRNDVILALCQQLGIDWREAERLVVTVESVNRRSIALQQSPFLVIIGVVTLIAGLVIFAYSLYSILVLVRISRGTLAGVATGFAMVVGGAWGSWKAISPLFKS